MQQVETGVDDMHFYDLIKCYSQDMSVKCLLVGRKIKILTFKVQEKLLIIQETVEEYFVYKNIVPEQIAFNDQFVMIAGYRFVDDGNKGEILNDTYDHSGIFIYNRLGRPGGSPWVR